MGKLHELLAVDQDLEKKFKERLDTAIENFSARPELYLGYSKSLRMKDDERKMEEEAAEEHKEVSSTVPNELAAVMKHAARYMDSMIQKEQTNQKATADLIVGGKTIAEGLPATFLLGLENRTKMLRRMVEEIPTLNTSIEWVEDENLPAGVYKSSHPEVSQKNEKKKRFQTVNEATEHHPAQVVGLDENVVVGVFTNQRYSGMISKARKEDLLERIDDLYLAAKKARQRANTTPVENVTIGKVISEYILG